MRMKKLIAALTSVIMLASAAAVPAGYTTGYAATGTVFSSNFDSGISDWGMYKESGGSGKLSAQDGKLALTVDSVGKVTYALQMYYDIIPLYQNGVYHLSFEISSTQNRFIEAMIQQNGGTYQAYTWKGINVTSTPTKVDYEFTMKAETDIMTKMVFNCGVHEDEDGVTSFPSHTIYLDNVSLELVDDSKVDYAASRPYEPDINVNQIGYKTNGNKTAVIRVNSESTKDVSNEFTVVNADTKAAVYTGTLSAGIGNSSAGETDWIADFSSVTTPGRYYIKSAGMDDSYTFEIGDNIYQNLLDDTVRMMYLQRCGTAVSDTAFGHKVCHNTKAKVYGTNEYIDVSGGWHDAGDYGRYVVPAAKTVADMLNAYGANKTAFTDNIGIPESGNGIPDVLDEVKYALDWMFKMQDSSTGGVHHKVTCENFPGFVMPEEETEELIVTPVTSTATADFCGSMALAYKYFRDIDAGYARECLDAAKKAYSYLQANPNFDCFNPSDITTGDYKDQGNTDKDERYWAAAQMYAATNDEKYLSEISTVRTGLGWSSVGDYGSIAIVTSEAINRNSEVYKNAVDSIVSQADKYVSATNASPYGSPITKYNWGSNMDVANSGIITALAAELTGNSSYLNAAGENLNYLLGKNPNGVCYVTGFGTVSPEHPHHRPSIALGKPMPGMLVGGVDSFLEDSAAKAYLRDYAQAKRWVDNDQSYSTNEVTTYWNSPLIYLLAVTDTTVASNTNMKGDVNCDGSVDKLDVAALQKYIVNKIKLTAEQAYNSDVNSDGRVDAMDVTKLRRLLTKGSNILPPPAVTTPVPQPPVTTTTTTVKEGMDMTADMIADFRQGKSQYFFASDGWTNGSCFDCGWYEKNTSFDGGVLNLTIDKDTSGKYNYSGAEYRTNDFYGYGYYETSMQAIKNDGVVSSFFTYTGPSDNNPWDEIDIEVLGKDTTQVQFNYYTNGTGNHEYMYDLGFDASQGFHRYGFDWQPDHITWYVDGKAVHTAYDNIPVTPGKIMMNVWPGITVDEWLKPFNGNTPLTARYEWVTYKK